MKADKCKGKRKPAPRLELNYSVPFAEQGMVNNEFTIAGIAINSTVTSNNHKFIAEELKNAAESLKGVPLLTDHENFIANIKGRVIESEFDETEENIKFKAIVKNKEIQKMIEDGLINSVSIGASVERIEENEEGQIIPRGIVLKELSLVAVPADEGATFGIAMMEAYKSSLNSQFVKGGNEMKEELKPKTQESEEIESEEAKPEETPEKSEESKEEESKEDTTESLLKKLDEKLDRISDRLNDLEVKSADVDEEPESKEESEEESKEEEDEEEDEEEAEESFKVSRGLRSFSFVGKY